ncbi:coth protein-domain-containing protein [Radiomyces spectabilis]|uniref:coth protein-domain-containing protein n=1 Tax=Radiomyces spectabilis TaxID=64574 RepID=UPI002220E063|nr:coth protein-domain-containing protein [Radiomyces spectabilis]KAI8388122.1 coth protein-domain-containing protein [Radiomyces spectabilis]
MYRLSILASLVALAYGHSITYNVISAGPTDSVAVVVDNVKYPLSPSSVAPILYTGEAPAATKGYHYVRLHGNQVQDQESFTRKPVNEDTTNEFYNRTWNSREIRQFPKLLEDLPVFNRMESQLHVVGEIPTFYFSANQKQIDNLHENSIAENEVLTNLTYIRNNEVHQIDGVEMQLSGRSSRWFPKLSYSLKLPKEQDLFGYRRLKLRAFATDPSYIREQLGYEILRSVGVPASYSSFARVVVNDQPLGLFGLVEAFKNPWLKNEFAGGEKYDQGILFQGGGASVKSMLSKAPADLVYRGEDESQYVNYKIKEEPDEGEGEADRSRIVEFTKFLQNAPITGSDAVEEWDQHVDTQTVIRNMALEYLLGFVDGYITNADNYYLYDDPESQRFIYMSSDLDLSLGSSFKVLDTIFVNDYEKYPGFNYTNRPLLKLLKIPEVKKQFQDLLVKVARELMVPNKINPYIDELVNLIREDVDWDCTLPRVNANFDVSTVFDPQHPDKVDGDDLFDGRVAEDMFNRVFHDHVPLRAAINGPTGHISLTSIKEWFARRSSGVLRTYA